MLYMVQQYFYTGYHTDNLFPTLNRTDAFAYLNKKYDEYYDDGSEVRWDGEEWFEYAHGSLISSFSVVEMELDKEL